MKALLLIMILIAIHQITNYIENMDIKEICKAILTNTTYYKIP